MAIVASDVLSTNCSCVSEGSERSRAIRVCIGERSICILVAARFGSHHHLGSYWALDSSGGRGQLHPGESRYRPAPPSSAAVPRQATAKLAAPERLGVSPEVATCRAGRGSTSGGRRAAVLRQMCVSCAINIVQRGKSAGRLLTGHRLDVSLFQFRFQCCLRDGASRRCGPQR